MRYIEANVAGLPDKKRSVFLVEGEGERPAKAGVWVEVFKIKDDKGRIFWNTDLSKSKGIPLISGWAKVEEGEKETKNNLPPLITLGGMRLSPEVAKQIRKHKMAKKGWTGESVRHGMSARGLASGRKKKSGIKVEGYIHPRAEQFFKQMKKGVCLGCGGTGYVTKMPENKRKICRLCGGSG